MSFLSEWNQQFHSYNRNIKLFFVFNLLWNTGLGMFSVIYNLYIKSLGYGQDEVGDVVAMTALGSALSLIPAGLLSDRLGPKRVAQIGLLFAIVALGFRACMSSAPDLGTAAFVSGFFLAVVQVTGIPFLVENSTMDQRVHLFSFNMALMMLANFLGNVGGGALTDFWHEFLGYSEVISLRITLLIGVGCAAVGLVPVMMFGPSTGESVEKQPKLPLRAQLKSKRESLKVIGWFTLLSLMTSSAGGLIVPYLNVYFADRFDASHTAIGIIVSLGQAATAIAYLIGPAIAHRIGEVRAVVVLQMSSIPFLLITAFSMDFMLASCGYLFRQALMNAANPFQTSIKMARVDGSLRGLANSMGDAAFNLGWFLVAPVNTYLVYTYGSYWGYAYAFCITAIIYCVVSCLFYLLFRKDRSAQAELS
ncbi:MFS transporter [Brevibacillus migulae]|uniref:MFS transporter n=1 Tax=Brevibacillus migulae TaxID=1644114 RepID=UPI001F34CF73|nr:MFS transporter [Brevibacillus migulae]